jgi:parallel beta-helix repeat protein
MALAGLGKGPVTVREGIYREEVRITIGGTAEEPLVLRAAPGARPVITGFEPLSGWKEEGGGLYSLTQPTRVTDLFVDAQRQPLARFPKADQPWIRVVADDPVGKKLSFESLPPVLESGRKGMMILIYCHSINSDTTLPLVEYSFETNSVVVDSPGPKFYPKTGDAAIILNAAALVTEPGEWSCQPFEEGFRILFRPRDPADLERTQTRARAQVLRISGEGAGHVVIEGFELTGGSLYGVYASNAPGLTLRRCTVYANGSTGRVTGCGIRIDKCSDFTLESSVVFANHYAGVSVTQGENITIRGCEFSANDGDGLIFTGRGNEPDAPLRGVKVTGCYLSRHFYLGHPDNSQIHSHVRDVTYENNVFFMSGQSVMIEKCEDMKFHNNLFFGATSRHVILGHGNAHRAVFQNNTFAFANYGSIGTAAKGVDLQNNVFYHNVLSYDSEDVKGDRNLFWSAREEDRVLVRSLPKWKSYGTPAEFAEETGFEAASRREDPGFKNVPMLQVIGRSTFFVGARDTIALEKNDAPRFAEGDVIEINGDGVARKVATVGEDFVTFAPPLPVLPFRNAFVWKWASGLELKIDLSSPVVGSEGQPGSSVDLASYQRGELDGSGKRSLPELSPAALAAMPRPDTFIYPFNIHLNP